MAPSSAPTWFSIANLQDFDTPALVVYPDRILENIRRLKNNSQGVDWLRPHVKTHKMAAVTRMLLEAGLYQFKCATIAEAEMLAGAGAPDVLLAYQPVGPKGRRLRSLVQAFPQVRFSCLVDNPATARELAGIFSEADLVLPVYLDLNVGMNRTGIRPGAEALALYQLLARLPGLTPAGLHAYDGHLRDRELAERRAKADAAFAPVTALAEAIQSQGLPVPQIIAGGSPTFPVHAGRPGVTSSPGTFIFWDWTYHSGLPEQPFEFAALVITRVISRLDETTLCLDLGHKAIAAENPLPRVIFLNAPDVKPVAQSEEHLVVQVDPASQYAVGDVFFGVPVHICPTCALYDQALVVRQGQIRETWAVTSRKRALTC